MLQEPPYTQDDERTALSLVKLAHEGREDDWLELVEGSDPVRLLAALSDWGAAFAHDLYQAQGRDVDIELQETLRQLGFFAAE